MKSITSKAVLLATLGAAMLAPAMARAAHPAPAATPGYGPEADYPVTIGDAYAIGGTTYTPADTLNYDAVGYARAGSEGSGISGAHHVLPLPCYVEVTSLDSGHTILVRLDRRGPMTGKQLIELSPAAWAQLGLPGRADAAVRVRRVNPPEAERAALRQGNHVPERMETPPGLRAALRRKLGVAAPHAPDEPPTVTLSAPPSQTATRILPPAPKPMAVMVKPAKPIKPVAPPPPPPVAAAPIAAPRPAPEKPKPSEPVKAEQAKTRKLTVQVAAFSNHASAEKVAKQVGGTVEASGKLFRVHIVTSTEEQAQAALAKAKHAGYAGAIIIHHD